MDRRKFIGLTAFAAPAASIAAEEKPPYDEWAEHLRDTMKFKAFSAERNLTLEVELIIPPENEISEAKNAAGEMIGYQWKGKVMAGNFAPGSTLLTKFRLEWDGKPVPIPNRLWNDLAALKITECNLDPKTIDPKFAYNFHEFLEGLQQPRILLSAENGTALIEWRRSEDCDSRSIIRWMVGRTGTVLRHRDFSDGC